MLISVEDSYRRPEHIYGVFIDLACLYQKLLPKKNCRWPFMTWNGLGDMRRGHWSQYSNSGCHSTCNPMFESVLNCFRPKEAAFNFLPLAYNGEVAILIWPWVTDIKFPRYTFYKYCYVYQSPNVLMWSVNRCSYDGHSNFLRWGHLAYLVKIYSN